MSQNVWLIYGYRMSDIAEWKTRTTTVTKYDPDTGAPYQKELYETYLTILNKEVPQPDEMTPTEWGILPIHRDVTVANIGYKEDGLKDFIWGYVLGEFGDFNRVDRFSGIKPIFEDNVGQAKGVMYRLMNELLDKVGLGWTNVETKMFLVGYDLA